MPKDKRFYVDTPKLLRWDSLDKFMFGYVMGMQRALPGNQLNKCMEMYMDDFLLNEDNYPLDHGLMMWYRMLKSYRTYRKDLQKLDK